MKNNFIQENCPFCPSEVGKIILRRKLFKVRMCSGCSLMWCDPLRHNEKFHLSDEKAYLKVAETGMKGNKKKLKLLSSFAPSASHKKLLEIGCMHGLFLSQAKEMGYSVLGLDLSNSAVKLANEKLPDRVKVGTLNETIHNTYDIVCAFNVIEHMDNPHIFIRESKRVLATNGYLMLETPSQESLYHFVMFFIAKTFPTSIRHIGINPGGHIFKFGKKVWQNILSKNGYKVVMMKSVSTPLGELLEKKTKKHSLPTLTGMVVFGLLARLTGTGNRIVVIAQSLPSSP